MIGVAVISIGINRRITMIISEENLQRRTLLMQVVDALNPLSVFLAV